MALLSLTNVLQAGGDPFKGYSNTVSYFLKYAEGTSFGPNGTSDVRIEITIAGRTHVFDVDTGSRGLYVSVEELGPDFQIDPDLSYPGEIDLSSSGRVSSGMWTPVTASLDVKDLAGNPKTVSTSFNILAVTTLGAQSGRTATFGVKDDADVTSVNLIGGGTVPVETDTDGKKFISLTNNGSANQQVTFADNPGVFNPVSNCGIGFDLSGESGGTGPVEDNKNQIYNPLINLEEMKDGTLVAGYIIRTDGIQLGFTAADKGYGYTRLNSTELTSDNSVPDWQTPTGRVVVRRITKLPGSVVMDSGIPNAFVSAPGLIVGTLITGPMSVYLMNSKGAVGYNINLKDASNELNPEKVLVVKAGTNGTYSQGKRPYQGQFFNTGRHVFRKFNMLYDAENGYMGVLPNAAGKSDTNIFFKPRPGGFPNPYARTKPPRTSS